MTINYARESVIDFTKPFMNLGISILFKAPKDPATEVKTKMKMPSKCCNINFSSIIGPLAVSIFLFFVFSIKLLKTTTHLWRRNRPLY